MILQINDKFRITTDENNVIIEERRVAGEKAKNPGVEIWKPVAFFRTLEQACTRILDMGVYESTAEDIKSLLQTMTQLKSEIATEVRGIRL